MRIGQFTDSFLPIVDGVGRVVHQYALSLCKKGQEVTVVAPMADTGHRGGYPFELCDFYSKEVPTQRQYSTGLPLLDPHYDMRMQHIPLDILHAHSPFIAGQEAIRLAKKRKLPLIGTFHSRYYDDFYKATNAQLIADLGVKYVVGFYEKCDEVWTVSDNSAEALHDYGYKGDIIVIPNGTPDMYPDAARAARAKERFGLGDRPTLFYCGQLNWKKNIATILEAVAAARGSGLDCGLILAGQGPDEGAIREKAAALVPDTIFAGHLSDEDALYGLYEAASLFVFPSVYDTSGLVIREAAAMGTPSVVVRGSAPAEPITDGENGYLCDNSAESLCASLLRALEDADKLRAVGAAARQTIHLPWDRVLDMVLERYQRLV